MQYSTVDDVGGDLFSEKVKKPVTLLEHEVATGMWWPSSFTGVTTHHGFYPSQ
jgi:hypothetical protein